MGRGIRFALKHHLEVRDVLQDRPGKLSGKSHLARVKPSLPPLEGFILKPTSTSEGILSGRSPAATLGPPAVALIPV
jgi:hypothetical protein